MGRDRVVIVAEPDSASRISFASKQEY